MKHLLLLFFCLVVVSCKKGGGALVEGRLIETGYETPVTNCTIKLLEIKNGNQGQYVDDAVTDSDGHFKIYYQRRFAYQYQYFVDTDKFLKIEGGEKAGKRKVHVVLRAMRKSYVKFTIKNTLADSVDLFFTNEYTYGKFRIAANSEKVLSPLLTAGYGLTEFTWHYTTCTTKFISPDKKEAIEVYNREDTIYNKLELN